jgi:hypothetical protein
MAINQWHGRKVVLVWVLAVGVMFAGLWLADQMGPGSPGGSVYVAMSAVTVPFFAAVLVTWRWMSGRE